MQIIAKRQMYSITSVVGDENDVDRLNVLARYTQIMHLKAHAEQGTVCKSVPPLDPVILIVGPHGCFTLDTNSLAIVIAAWQADAQVDAYVVDVDQFEALQAEGGDYRKDIYVDGKSLAEYVGLPAEGEPMKFIEALDLVRTPEEPVQSSE